MSTYSPLRVLIVDDEPLICWSIAETLAYRGDTVIEAGTGAQAIRALADAAAPVDVILLDYQLPDVRSLALLSTVRRLWPGSRRTSENSIIVCGSVFPRRVGSPPRGRATGASAPAHHQAPAAASTPSSARYRHLIDLLRDVDLTRAIARCLTLATARC